MLKKYHYYDSTKVEHYFVLYKASPTEEGLALLYDTLDPVIVSVLQRYSATYRYKHPDDFEDIMQSVKVDIFRVLEKLVSISETGDQVLSIVIKAVAWSFKVHYKALKKQRGLSFEVCAEALDTRIEASEAEEPSPLLHSWTPYNPVYESTDSLFKTFISVPPSQYAYSFLKSLPSDLLDKALKKNRYKDKEPMMSFCINAYLEGRSPSTRFITKRWSVTNANYWLRYAFILLKLSILDVYRR